MKREIAWTTKSNKKANVTVELITKKTISADGDAVTVPTCEIKVIATCGDGLWMGRPERISIPQMPDVVAHIGRLTIDQDNLDKINVAIAEAEASPEWQAKIKKAKEAEKSAREYEESTRRINDAMSM